MHNDPVRIIMFAINFIVFAYFISLSTRGAILLRKAHQESVHMDLKKLRIKCIATCIYSLGMLSFGIMYFFGVSLLAMFYILLAFTFIVSSVSRLSGGIFLSGKELKQLADLLKSR